MKRFLLLGDSITEQSVDVADQGWSFHLLSAYRRKVDFYLRGFSGYNTRWLCHSLTGEELTLGDGRKVKLPQLLPEIGRSKFDLAVIFLGANDAVAESVYQHVPLDEYKKNLKQMISLVNADRVAIITPPPYDAEKYMRTMLFPVSHRSDERTKIYAAAVKSVTEDPSLPVPCICVDINAGLRERFPDSQSLSAALSDGLHLAPAGNKAVADQLMAEIAKHFPELAAEKIEMLLPSHRDFMPAAT